MADKAELVEEGVCEEVCLELVDLLLQGLLLLLGWGMAVEEEDDDEGGIWVEVVAGTLADKLTLTADDGACSVITEGCEVMPSEESARKKRQFIKQEYQKMRKETNQVEGGSGGDKKNPDEEGESSLTSHKVAL